MPQNSTDPKETVLEKPSFPKLLAQRILVHCSGSSLGYFLSNATGVEDALLLTYLGTICLIPRGNWKKPTWFIPAGTGLVLALVMLVLGAPIWTAIFWGGVASWLQRIWQNQGRLSWDWIVAPFIIFSLEAAFAFTTKPLFAGIAIIVVLLAGICAQFAYGRVYAEKLHEESLKEDLARLQSLVRQKIKPEPLAGQIKILAMHAETLAKVLTGKVREGLTAIERVHKATEAIVSYLESSKPSQSGWSKGLLKSDNWGRKGQNSSEDLVTLLKETNAFLQENIKKLKPTVRRDGDNSFENTCLSFEESAAELASKAVGLPEKAAGHVQSIGQSTLEIVKNMREDPADRTPGERFLNRYLTAVHKIVDEYLRLSTGPKQKDLEQALQKSEELLERMDKAFQDELANLLQNDAINFTAEVDALDAMLKMKGH
ncbi:MAG: 5-bromo-4-chloroindolyl phosphate hydrolysis family protein [Desulfovibrio sp.]|nr:5-bromo-4-chloroindolyl phosphate hydrolysis family protein [Desulfovibrio sp.]